MYFSSYRRACRLLLAIGLFCFPEKIVAEALRPNIVLILCDDLGYADVGFNGAKDIRTPELDCLADQGTIFSSAYVCHPFCGPSRMGLMTGRYPHEFGAPFNLPNGKHGIEEFNKRGVPVRERLISKVLQDSGYLTGAVGKWHMGTRKEFHPNSRGFDDYYGFLGGGHDYFPEKFSAQYERQKKAGKEVIEDYVLPLEHNGVEVKETEYITDALSREAVRFVKDAAMKERPFFLYLAYNAPHSPLEAKEEDLEKYAAIKDEKRRIYAAMVHAVDRGVGKLVVALKEAGEYENTLIVFLSDNGGKLVLGANNGPLKDGKGSTCEGGFRIPMFFHWPGKVSAGKKYDHPVSSLDFYPTFAGLAGAAIPEGKHLDGVDMWDDLRAGRSARKGGMIYALRHREGYTDVGARRDAWKIRRTGRGPWKLFRISEDIGEDHDLSRENPERVREMVAEVEKWSRSHTEPLWHHEQAAADDWERFGMPHFEETFEVD